jgi:metal-responsive CopG/Arc/MetJ family transcriptional regulator
MMNTVKTTVSIADDLYRRADDAAADCGLNRSQFYSQALTAYLRELEDDAVTHGIDRAMDDRGTDDMAAWTDAAARAALACHG